jgi:hypothetical protein
LNPAQEPEQDRLFYEPQTQKPERDYPKDEIWDAFVDEFGPVLTKSERGRRNRACRELRAAGVTGQQVRIAIDYCRGNFATFTEMAVCGWISRALHEHSKDPFDVENVIQLAMRRGI